MVLQLLLSRMQKCGDNFSWHYFFRCRGLLRMQAHFQHPSVSHYTITQLYTLTPVSYQVKPPFSAVRAFVLIALFKDTCRLADAGGETIAHSLLSQLFPACPRYKLTINHNVLARCTNAITLVGFHEVLFVSEAGASNHWYPSCVCGSQLL